MHSLYRKKKLQINNFLLALGTGGQCRHLLDARGASSASASPSLVWVNIINLAK